MQIAALNSKESPLQMREFSHLSPRIAFDEEANIKCRSTGLVELLESKRQYSLVYQLYKDDNAANSKRFSVLKPSSIAVKRENGVSIIQNIIGSRPGSTLDDILRLKSFCEFSGDDFSFIKYIASAVAYSEDGVRPYRATVVVPIEALNARGVRPDRAPIIGSEYVCLIDSHATFL